MLTEELSNDKPVVDRQSETMTQDRIVEIYAPAFADGWLMLSVPYFFDEIDSKGAEWFVKNKCNGMEYVLHHKSPGHDRMDVVMKINPNEVKDTMPYEYMISGSFGAALDNMTEENYQSEVYCIPFTIYRLFKILDENNESDLRMQAVYYTNPAYV